MTHPLTVALTVPTDPTLEIEEIIDFAQRAEAAGVSALVIDERVRGTATLAPFETFTVADAIATRTREIALIASVGANANAPYTLARKLGSLDIFSGGRAGWRFDPDGWNADVADELTDVVVGLLDSYSDNATPRDQARGIYYQRDGRRALHHEGEFFRVDGPLNLSRPPQGHPVLVVEVDAQTPDAWAVFARHRAEIVVTPDDVPLEEEVTAPVHWVRFDEAGQVSQQTLQDAQRRGDVDGALIVIPDREAAEHALALVADVVGAGAAAPTPTEPTLPSLDAEIIPPQPRAERTLRERLGLTRPERITV